MRGSDRRSGELFSYVDVEARVRSDHPLRAIRSIVNETLEALSGEFDGLYAAGAGRPSIPPEMLLRAMLLQAFYTIRSERQLMERLEFDLLFRWFVGLSTDEPAWDHSTFSKNRDRLLDGEVAAKFLAAVLIRPKVKRLLSSQHFSTDGTLIEAWASLKSFKPKSGAGGGAGDPPGDGAGGGTGGRNAEVDFKGERRSNATHRGCPPAGGDRSARGGAERQATAGGEALRGTGQDARRPAPRARTRGSAAPALPSIRRSARRPARLPAPRIRPAARGAAPAGCRAGWLR
jgi:transposase